jgi:predicted alpha/beta superfamily hydrolase
MHDGQNLFDAATSYSGEWGVDETLAALARDELDLIVVGFPNGGDGRYAEYAPYKGDSASSSLAACRGRLSPLLPAPA